MNLKLNHMKLGEAFSTIHASIQTIILSKFTEVKHFANCAEFTLCYNCLTKNYTEITKLREGNVFTPVSHSVHRRGVVPSGGAVKEGVVKGEP